MSPKAQHSHIGSILKSALLAGHVEQHRQNRRIYYSLRVLVPFVQKAD